MTDKKETEIVTLRPHALPSAAASEAAALISMIQQAAQNPAIDVARIERMYEMYERAAARNARAAYDEALAEMQPKLPVVEKRGRGHNDVAYALWEDIAEAITRVTAQHGFSLTFRVNRNEGMVAVTAILAHRDGHREETTLSLPVDSSGSKNAVQAIGSSTSYGKRYTAGLLLNIITKGEDNDAASVATVAQVSEQQLQQLTETMETVGADLNGFLKYFKVAQLSDLKAADFPRAMAALNKKKGGRHA